MDFHLLMVNNEHRRALPPKNEEKKQQPKKKIMDRGNTKVARSGFKLLQTPTK